MFNELVYWPEGHTPYDFQLTALDFSVDHIDEGSRSFYLNLEPGLGKTIVAALLINYLNLSQHHTAYYVCPPFLVTNTEAEFLSWGVQRNQFVIIPDTKIKALQTIKSGPKVLFVDEAHRFKNDKANRTLDLYELAKEFNLVVFMSGTPMPNSRPYELWPILSRFAPHLFGTQFMPFGRRYCGGHKTRFGWDFRGFTHEDEFWQRLKPWMLTMKKADVLKSLPPKREGLLTVGPGMPPTLSKLEKSVLKHFAPKDLMKKEIPLSKGQAGMHLIEYLKHLGELKVKHVFPYIESILFDTKENIILFAHHTAVIDQLELWLKNFKPLVITGSTPVKKRQAIVDEYQQNPERRVFIGNITAAGIGFTLTKATRVIFVEFLWTDGENQQAADRAHRIGQTETVLVQYVVLKDSFDRRRMEIILNKREKAL